MAAIVVAIGCLPITALGKLQSKHGMGQADSWQELIPYNESHTKKKPHVIVLVNGILPSTQSPILNRISSKTNAQSIHMSYGQFTQHLFKGGYQLMAFTYQNRNEWTGPNLNHHHMLHQYPLRNHVNQPQSERHIITHALNQLDAFVQTQHRWRPMMMTLHLPPKTIHNLTQNAHLAPTFFNRRDFSLVTLYHLVHQRRYLHPFVVMVYSSIQSNSGLLLDEHRQLQFPLL